MATPTQDQLLPGPARPDSEQTAKDFENYMVKYNEAVALAPLRPPPQLLLPGRHTLPDSTAPAPTTNPTPPPPPSLSPPTSRGSSSHSRYAYEEVDLPWLDAWPEPSVPPKVARDVLNGDENMLRMATNKGPWTLEETVRVQSNKT